MGNQFSKGLLRIPENRVAAAGTNYLSILLPQGAKIHLINANNATTANLAFRITLCDASQNADASHVGLVLFDGEQDTLYNAVWQSAEGFPIYDYRRIIVTFIGCIVGDALSVVVGFVE